jgi:hypothetical protein
VIVESCLDEPKGRTANHHEKSASRFEVFCRRHSGDLFHRRPRSGGVPRPCTDPRAIGGRVGRYYDPSTDQFLSVDPLVAETGQPYAYTGDDPVNSSDPSGMLPTIMIQGPGGQSCSAYGCGGAATTNEDKAATSYTVAQNTAHPNNAEPTQCNSSHGPSPEDNPCDPTIQAFDGDIRTVLNLLGQPATDTNVYSVDIIAWGENRGQNGCTTNPNDINVIEGHPSCGLIQLIPTTFAAYRDPSLPDNIFNPLANLYAGLNYGINTYGSIPQIPGVITYERCNGYGDNGCYQGY